MLDIIANLLNENISLSNWLLQAMAMSFTALLLPGLRITSIVGPFLMVISLAFVNVHVWNAALFFQVPDTFTIHTLVTFVANGLLFWILVKLLPGIAIKGFLPALFAPILFTLCNLVIDLYGDRIDWSTYLSTLGNMVAQLKTFLMEAQAPITDASLPSSTPPPTPLESPTPNLPTQ